MFQSLMSSCVGVPAQAGASSVSRLTRRQRIQVLSSEAPSESEAIARPSTSQPDAPVSAARRTGETDLPEIAISVRRCDSRLEHESHEFQQPVILIGTNPDADLVLPDRRLEGMHLYLQEIEGRWAAMDLSAISGNGVEESRQPAQWFDPGDELQVGPYSITHTPRSIRTSSIDVYAQPACEPATASVQFLNSRRRADGQSSHTIASPLTLLGSSRHCELCLTDQSVAGVHASLIRTPHGLWVADLIRNQTVRVDEQPVYWSQLDDGAVLQVGKFRFLIHLGGTRGRRDGWFEKNRGRHPAAEVRPPSGISEEMVLSLMQHFSEMQQRIVEMQTRFSEHSQQQMQLMTNLLRCFAERQAPSLSLMGAPARNRQQLKASEADLRGKKRGRGNRVKKKRKGGRGQGTVDDFRRLVFPAVPAGEQREHPVPEIDLPPAEQNHLSDDSRSRPSAAKQVASQDGAPDTAHPSDSPPDTSGTQTRLTDRMASSAARQMRFWQRLWKAFG